MKECRNTGNCEEQWGTVRSQQKLIVSILIPLQPSVLCAEILSALPGLEASCASYGHSYGDILCKLNIEVFSSIQNYWMVNMLFIFILYTHTAILLIRWIDPTKPSQDPSYIKFLRYQTVGKVSSLPGITFWMRQLTRFLSLSVTLSVDIPFVT